MTRWVVQALEDPVGLSGGARVPSRTWRDIYHPQKFDGDPSWEAEDAGAAFHAAVLTNERERIKATSYRILPWEGGGTINVALNLTSVEHAAPA